MQPGNNIQVVIEQNLRNLLVDSLYLLFRWDKCGGADRLPSLSREKYWCGRCGCSSPTLGLWNNIDRSTCSGFSSSQCERKYTHSKAWAGNDILLLFVGFRDLKGIQAVRLVVIVLVNLILDTPCPY
jgi:hypothetical protein